MVFGASIQLYSIFCGENKSKQKTKKHKIEIAYAFNRFKKKKKNLICCCCLGLLPLLDSGFYAAGELIDPLRACTDVQVGNCGESFKLPQYMEWWEK